MQIEIFLNFKNGKQKTQALEKRKIEEKRNTQKL